MSALAGRAGRTADADDGAGSQADPQAEAQEREQVRLGELEAFIGFNLRLAQDASFRAFTRRVGEISLKPGRFAALMVIHDNPGVTPGALGRAIARDKSTITPLVQALLRDGLVERTQSQTDRRSFSLRLTEAGEAFRRKLLQPARAHDRKLDDIVGSRKDEFLQLLRAIVDGLD
jgi:DNA-binding MarR family transcriptional regulator